MEWNTISTINTLDVQLLFEYLVSITVNSHDNKNKNDTNKL